MSVTISVVSTDGVLGGKPRIEGTRIGVHQVGSLVREHGWSRGSVAEEFHLTSDEIVAALEYYDAHPDEMVEIRREREDTYARLQAQSRAEE